MILWMTLQLLYLMALPVSSSKNNYYNFGKIANHFRKSKITLRCARFCVAHACARLITRENFFGACVTHAQENFRVKWALRNLNGAQRQKK